MGRAQEGVGMADNGGAAAGDGKQDDQGKIVCCTGPATSADRSLLLEMNPAEKVVFLRALTTCGRGRCLDVLETVKSLDDSPFSLVLLCLGPKIFSCCTSPTMRLRLTASQAGEKESADGRAAGGELGGEGQEDEDDDDGHAKATTTTTAGEDAATADELEESRASDWAGGDRATAAVGGSGGGFPGGVFRLLMLRPHRRYVH